MSKFNILLLFLLFFGCTYKLPKVINSTEFNLAESNSTALPRTIINHPDIDYINPSIIFTSIIFLVFLISFFPVFHKICIYIKKKILTFIKK
jgi:hypothetical protein